MGGFFVPVSTPYRRLKSRFKINLRGMAVWWVSKGLPFGTGSGACTEYKSVNTPVVPASKIDHHCVTMT